MSLCFGMLMRLMPSSRGFKISFAYLEAREKTRWFELDYTVRKVAGGQNNVGPKEFSSISLTG